VTPTTASTIRTPGLAAAIVWGALLLLSGDARGATVPYLTDGQLVARASRVVRARVLSAQPAVDARGGPIRTITRLAVIEDFTGLQGAHLAVVELGGAIDDRTLVVPGTPRLQPGEDVVLCLERAPGGGWRTVALDFATFRVVDPDGHGPGAAAPLLRRDVRSGLHVIGRPAAEPPPASLDEFRRLVGAIKGRRPWRPVTGRATDASRRRAPGDTEPDPTSEPSAQAAQAAAPGAPTAAAFTLLGGGMRWFEADRGVPVLWYRNAEAPAPVNLGDGDPEILLALAAWTAPPHATIDLRYGGSRTLGGASPFCGTSNTGSGLITFEDPTGELAGNVLALGGGCVARTGARSFNGIYFQAFSHAFVVFNRAIETGVTYRSPTNFARILEHEVGHGIGLGHTDMSALSGAANIMYPACCLASTPVPPALGPDDLAGLEFIYPAGLAVSCAFSVIPLSAAFPAGGGTAHVAVTTAPSCEWTAATDASWVTLDGDLARRGTGSIAYKVPPNDGGARQAVIRVAGQSLTVSQAGADTDADGLSDAWESRFGLDPAAADGEDGPGGDPDGDGRSNADESREGTHPRGFFARAFSEGAVGPFFDVRFALFNPSATARSRALLRLMTNDGRAASMAVELPPFARRTIRPAADLNLVVGEFGTLVESDEPLVVDRTMTWGSGAYGAHGETGVAEPASRWYFAEGATHSGFELFFLLSNPGHEDADVSVRYLLPSPAPPIDRTYQVAAGRRRTVWVDVEDPALAATDVSTVITVASGPPVVAERAMYLSREGALFAAGHASAGVTATATRWWFAEGATGPYFDSFLLVVNPSTEDALLDVAYLLPDGERVSVPHRAPAGSRYTIWVDAEDARVADAAMGIEVASTNGVPVVVERAMWWPGPTAATWDEAHVSEGFSATAERWATADAEVGGPSDAATFLLVANASPLPGSIRVTLAFEDAPGVPVSRVFDIGGSSRLNVDVGREFPEAAGRRCSALVERVGSTPLALVVERATYWDANGRSWAAGAAVGAVPLR
jgi:hypothetical protein